ncbi:MotE family protein [Venenivibrio stagnispumantis]|nr:hypothetical protein [Venenivibrio stagnispumantis]MCW4572576.1 hypothetical protein [Venenivibrio stagnispumantis]
MRFLIISLLICNITFAQIEEKETKKELKRIEEARESLRKEIEKNQALLEQIKKEKEALEALKTQIENEKKAMQQERYKNLAKIFEKMDPELAGQKLSKIDDPKIAAYIIYNMNEKKAGAVLQNTDPQMVNKIVKALTEIKNENKP